MGDITHSELPSKTAQHSLPRIVKTHNAGQLVVHDKPYLVLGAELQNSSFSSPSHMASIWQKMKDMNVNTVLGSMPWEMIEPEEGRFDFAVLDQLIQDARRHDLKLILLWFGSWKNGQSEDKYWAPRSINVLTSAIRHFDICPGVGEDVSLALSESRDTG